MDHIAIMNPHLDMIRKIVEGRKPVESRWYFRRYAPWGQINSGDAVYFKDSCKPVSARAEVEGVLQFDNLNFMQIQSLLDKYALQIGLDKSAVPAFFEKIRDKKYGILVSLKNPAMIEPFEIDKSGFGSGAAWLVVGDINQVRK